MKIEQVITLKYTTDSGGEGVFSATIDPASPASAYEQVKAAMQRAGWTETPPDDPAFEATINEQYNAAAEADRAAIRPAQVAALLDRIDARQAQIDQRRAAIIADLQALPTATAAQQRQILTRMLQAEDDMLNAERRELDVLERIVKVLRS